MVDLAFFVVIIMVFIIAYGVAAQVILYPNSSFGWRLVRDVLKKPYFQMYGELFLEEIEGAFTELGSIYTLTLTLQTNLGLQPNYRVNRVRWSFEMDV